VQSAIQVGSEIGKLRQVLVHRPGLELSRVTPETMNEHLFDDILYLEQAQRDHDFFVETLQSEGAQVLYLTELASTALLSSRDAKEAFVSDLIDQSGFSALYKDELTRYFLSMSEGEIVQKVICGVTLEDFGIASFGGGLSRHKSPEGMYPMPNLYFQRDPMATIGAGVAMSSMFFPIRNRETIFSKYIFKYHPDFKGKVKYYYEVDWPFSIEGGDILNLSENVLGIGISERTCPAAIDTLAKTIFSDETAKVHTVLAFEIPKKHNCMHLDTVFTQVDHGKFLQYSDIMERIPYVYVLKKTGHGTFDVEKCRLTLEELLRKHLELDKITLIPLGGGCTITAAREQWNAAANTLAIAPGKVISYDRNETSQRLLEEAGVTVLNIPSGELARGRGGPRCMSMPLIREDV